jgi:hypothetical protein
MSNDNVDYDVYGAITNAVEMNKVLNERMDLLQSNPDADLKQHAALTNDWLSHIAALLTQALIQRAFFADPSRRDVTGH